MTVIEFKKETIEKYKAIVRCINCGNETKLEIPKGTLVAEVNIVCANCGCTNKQVTDFWDTQSKPPVIAPI